MLRLLLLTIATVVMACAAQADGRHALVISVDKYTAMRPLRNAVSDGRAVRDALEALDFDVRLVSDKDLKGVRRELQRFREDAAGADAALVFFSGHGIEIGGENRLLTTDSDGSSMERLKQTSLPLEEVRDAVAEAGAVGLILLDACRNDPFGGSAADGRGATVLASAKVPVRPGLVRAPGRAGKAGQVLFAFSASPGETAADGAGDNSPFSQALAKYLPTDGLEIRSVFTLVQQEVYDRSRGAQLPYVESGLPTTFFAAQADGEALPERERLLLAMADLTGDIRALAEQVSAEFDVPLAPLYGSLLSRNAAPGLAQPAAVLLREAAERYVAMRQQIGLLSSADPAVSALREKAEQAVSLGSFEAAADELQRAAALDRSSIETLRQNTVDRQRSYAASLTLLGGVRESQADFAEAARIYREAGDVYAEIGAKALTAQDRLSLWDASNGLQNAVKAGLMGQVELQIKEIQAMILQRRAELEPATAELAAQRAAAEADYANALATSKGLREATFSPEEAVAALDSALCVARAEVAARPDDTGWRTRLAYSLITSTTFGPGGKDEAAEARALLADLRDDGSMPDGQVALLSDALAQTEALPVSMADLIGVSRPPHRTGCRIEDALRR